LRADKDKEAKKVTVAKDTQPPGQGWLQIIREESLEAFAGHFAQDATLDASVLDEQVKGPRGIRRLFSATASMYETFAFTRETTQGSRTYLEWEGTTLGLAVVGVTILARNSVGKIESVRLMHCPRQPLLAFSAELARRLHAG
jgi:hypothetical protein